MIQFNIRGILFNIRHNLRSIKESKLNIIFVSTVCANALRRSIFPTIRRGQSWRI